MKQTAVEWLIEQLKEYDWADIKDSQNWVIKIDALVLTAKVEQAKAMEKEQIIKADLAGVERTIIKVSEYIPLSDTLNIVKNIKQGVDKHEEGEQYYNETYETKTIK